VANLPPGSLAFLSGVGLEIAQQAIQTLLVVIVVFPLREVGDVPGQADIGTAKVSITKADATEVSIGEVRSYVGGLLSPFIPSLNALLDQFEVLLICHLVYSPSFSSYYTEKRIDMEDFASKEAL
jgi:hypothetical protein